MEKEWTEDLGIENPMLRSGIALAGANTSLRKNINEGFVSSEEILVGLKLKETQWWCCRPVRQGLGDVQSGEGVFGLKRSFILSGAKTVVMSLWKIPSKETEELMKEFYTKWLMENQRQRHCKRPDSLSSRNTRRPSIEAHW